MDKRCVDGDEDISVSKADSLLIDTVHLVSLSKQ
jgi:hypothetical protein